MLLGFGEVGKGSRCLLTNGVEADERLGSRICLAVCSAPELARPGRALERLSTVSELVVYWAVSSEVSLYICVGEAMVREGTLVIFC